MTEPIAVTILTGFLGAGKTTLINSLLQQKPDLKCAIIENEFGAINIDGAFLHKTKNANIIELSNGCVCCSVRGEFSQAMVELMQKRQQGLLDFDHIIIETTGLADPSPIAQAFFVEPELRETMMLDACVVLVDALHIMKQLDEHAVVALQIGFADLIIITKTDYVDEAAKQAIAERLKAMNIRAKILIVENGNCPPEKWLNIAGFALDNDLSSIVQKTKKHSQFGAAQAVGAQSYNDTIESFILESGIMDTDLIGAWMEQIIDDFGNDMLRYKGILAVHDEERRLLVQGVHKIVGFDYGDIWHNNESKQSNMVIIGRNLPKEILQQSFVACCQR